MFFNFMNVLSIAAVMSYYGIIYFAILTLVYATDSSNDARIKYASTNDTIQETLATVYDSLQADIADSDTDSELEEVNSTAKLSSESEQEPTVDLTHDEQPVELVEFKDTHVPYKHEFWPSPRPVNFVKAILDDDPTLKVEGRLAHVKAVDILANRASMSRREFLGTNPITYSERYMKGINAMYLLKDSIDRLETLLLQESNKFKGNSGRKFPIY